MEDIIINGKNGPINAPSISTVNLETKLNSEDVKNYVHLAEEAIAEMWILRKNKDKDANAKNVSNKLK